MERLEQEDSREAQNERRAGCGPSASAFVHRLAASATPPEPVLAAIKPPTSKKGWLRFILTHIPILQWIWTYKLEYLIPDIMSGLTVGVMHIPQGLAFAFLTGLDPVYGLYTSFVPVIIYSVLGTSRQLSVGTFAVICTMVGESLDHVMSVQGLDECRIDANSHMIINGTNITCGEMEAEIAISLAFTAGIIMTLMGFFRLGIISVLLSEPLTSGYIAGATIYTYTTQLPNIFGIQIKLRPFTDSLPDMLTLPRMWVEALRQIFQWPKYINTASLIVFICGIILFAVLMVTNQRLVSKLKVCCCFYSKEGRKCNTTRKFKWPLMIPIPLVLVIVGTSFSVAIDLERRFNVSVVGEIPASLPPLSVPRGRYMLATLTNAFAIAIVTWALNMSLVQLYSKKHGYATDSNQEFVAYGIGNIVGAFFSSFSSVASLARTAVQNDSGGKTQLVGLVSSLVVGVVLVSLDFIFYSLPKPILAAVICGSSYGMLKKTLELKKFYKLSWNDTIVWLIVVFSALFFGMELSLAFGILSTLLLMVFQAALPHYNVMKSRDEDWRFGSCGEKDVRVFQFHAPLCYVSYEMFHKKMKMVAQLDNESPAQSGGDGCVQVLVHKLGRGVLYRGLTQGSSGDLLEHHDESGPLTTIIIDFTSIAYLDGTGMETLVQIIKEFDLKDIQVILANLSLPNVNMLKRSNFFSCYGNEWIFPTVQDAVEHSINGRWLRPGSQQAGAKSNAIEMEKLPEQKGEEPHSNAGPGPDIATNAMDVEVGSDSQATKERDLTSTSL